MSAKRAVAGLTVSFDQNTAVYGGKRLVAEDAANNLCTGCGMFPCSNQMGGGTRFCCDSDRKDGRYIIWKEASA